MYMYFDASLTKPLSVYWDKLNAAARALWKNGSGPSASKNSATADKGESSLRFREKLHGALSFSLGMYLAYKVYNVTKRPKSKKRKMRCEL